MGWKGLIPITVFLGQSATFFVKHTELTQLDEGIYEFDVPVRFFAEKVWTSSGMIYTQILKRDDNLLNYGIKN